MASSIPVVPLKLASSSVQLPSFPLSTAGKVRHYSAVHRFSFVRFTQIQLFSSSLFFRFFFFCLFPALFCQFFFHQVLPFFILPCLFVEALPPSHPFSLLLPLFSLSFLPFSDPCLSSSHPFRSSFSLLLLFLHLPLFFSFPLFLFLHCFLTLPVISPRPPPLLLFSFPSRSFSPLLPFLLLPSPSLFFFPSLHAFCLFLFSFLLVSLFFPCSSSSCSFLLVPSFSSTSFSLISSEFFRLLPPFAFVIFLFLPSSLLIFLYSLIFFLFMSLLSLFLLHLLFLLLLPFLFLFVLLSSSVSSFCCSCFSPSSHVRSFPFCLLLLSPCSWPRTLSSLPVPFALLHFPLLLPHAVFCFALFFFLFLSPLPCSFSSISLSSVFHRRLPSSFLLDFELPLSHFPSSPAPPQL